MESFAKFIVLSNSGKKSLEETLGLIDKGDIVGILQELYMDECRQQEVYENYRYLLFGPSGIGVKEHLEEHMKEEQGHRDILQRYIVSLNSVPTIERHPIPVPDQMTLQGLMKLNSELESSTVEKYSLVVKGLEKLNSAYHVALLNDLQTITSQEMEHIQDLERWLREIL